MVKLGEMALAAVRVQQPSQSESAKREKQEKTQEMKCLPVAN